jgi:hypothetical protein
LAGEAHARARCEFSSPREACPPGGGGDRTRDHWCRVGGLGHPLSSGGGHGQGAARPTRLGRRGCGPASGAPAKKIGPRHPRQRMRAGGPRPLIRGGGTATGAGLPTPQRTRAHHPPPRRPVGRVRRRGCGPPAGEQRESAPCPTPRAHSSVERSNALSQAPRARPSRTDWDGLAPRSQRGWDRDARPGLVCVRIHGRAWRQGRAQRGRRCPPNEKSVFFFLVHHHHTPRARATDAGPGPPTHTASSHNVLRAALASLMASDMVGFGVWRGGGGGGKKRKERIERGVSVDAVLALSEHRLRLLCLGFLSRRARARRHATQPHTKQSHHVLLLPGHEPPAERGPRQRPGQQVRAVCEGRESGGGGAGGVAFWHGARTHGLSRDAAPPARRRRGPGQCTSRRARGMYACVRPGAACRKHSAKTQQRSAAFSCFRQPRTRGLTFPFFHAHKHPQPHLSKVCGQEQRHDARDGQEE